MTGSETRLLFLKLEEIESNLKEIDHPTGWTDLRGASNYCGFSISTLKRAIRADRLKCSKRHGKLMFRHRWIDQFVLLGHSKRLTITERMEMDQ